MSQITASMDGTLLNWLKNVGDSVNQGDVIAEVEADKATVEIEATESGVISAVSAQPGDEIKTGQAIGTIGEGGGAAAPAKQAEAAAPKQEQTPAPEQASPEAEYVDEEIAKEGQKAPAKQSPVLAATPGAPAGNAARTNGAPASNGSTTDDGRIKASPVARKIAEEKGIDLAQVSGTGPNGRITKEDVEGFTPSAAPTKQAEAAPAAASGGLSAPAARKLPAEGPDVEYIDLTTMRKRIAAVTVESKQWIPHFYVTTEIDVEPLLALRKQINEGLPEESKISVNDMVVKATALTLRQYPNLNTHYYGDRFVRHKRINIGIAVALPKGGLINVVAQDADKVSLGTMAAKNKEMFARAREGKIKPEDITGATFTVSNLGPYNVEHFLAIINPPEAGILAVGTASKVPVVKADGTLGVGNRMKVTISVDHRVSDGAEGAQYLQAFKTLLENPMRMLV
ncbi:MAG: 2-oxo acid dehydrogenase subunit E2 [Chloroflexi bacterium]|nr:2-oxo acid dehydrogenase subunit E2 [Chloroflexota bacterium]MCC6892782.1 2-oxo acid dehydrogenase subunit E2 [Anaerolineae bacterium]